MLDLLLLEALHLILIKDEVEIYSILLTFYQIQQNKQRLQENCRKNKV